MEEVVLQEVTYNTRNVTEPVEFSADMGRRDFGIGSLRVGITEDSI
jgi:hypothetical protein